MSRDDTFRLLLKTLLKELFPNKGEILSCKFVKPCKNRKTHKSITPEQEINPVQNSSPFQGNVQIPLPGHNAQSNARGMPGGGCLSFNLTGTLVIDFLAFSLLYYIQFISKTFRREANVLSKIKTKNFSNDI